MTKRGVKKLTEEDIAHIEAMKKMCKLENLHAWSTERYQTDPEYRRKVNQHNRERHKRQFDTDPEYREKVREYERNYRETHKDELNAQRRERYHNDPEYREKMKARIRANRETHKEERNAKWRERYHNDPEYREKVKAYQRAYYQKKRRPPQNAKSDTHIGFGESTQGRRGTGQGRARVPSRIHA